jgi:predicted transposase YbfD/YdcC
MGLTVGFVLRVWGESLCTVLSGGRTATDMAPFAREKEALENGVPSHDTFSRVFRFLDPSQFRACFQRFMARFAESCQVVAIDGKVVRRSFDKASGKSALHMVSAWGAQQRLGLAQIATDAKSNEITAVPKLLQRLCLKGTIVTVDALSCQREIAQQTIDQGGDYAMALKGNQATLYEDVRTFLDDPQTKVAVSKPEVEGDHGRIETRTAAVATDIDWLQEQHQLAGPEGGRQGDPYPRDSRQDLDRNRLLPSQPTPRAGALQCGRALALGRGKPTPPVSRCRHGRKIATEPARTMVPKTSPSCATWPFNVMRKDKEKGLLPQQIQTRGME